MTLVPGMGASVLGLTLGTGGTPAAPSLAKSFVFNGSNEGLTRTFSTTAPNQKTWTMSMWVKVVAYMGGANVCSMFQVLSPAEDHFMLLKIYDNGDELITFQDAAWMEQATPLTPDISEGVWEHFVMRFDCTQATADDRVRFYRNGTLMVDGTADQVALNENSWMFLNGYSLDIGAEFDVAFFSNCKMAFIDLLHGVSVDANSFAFSNVGVWTRKPYVGSRGTYGFSLDGTDGFNDVSGNNQHFTGVNMDASNLDGADRPPFVMV